MKETSICVVDELGQVIYEGTEKSACDNRRLFSSFFPVNRDIKLITTELDLVIKYLSLFSWVLAEGFKRHAIVLSDPFYHKALFNTDGKRDLLLNQKMEPLFTYELSVCDGRFDFL